MSRPAPAGPGAAGGGFAVPSLILAADHRARGVMTIERYDDYLRGADRGPAPLRRHPGHRPAAGRPGGLGRRRAATPHLPLAQPHRAGRIGLRARRPPGGQRLAGRRGRLDGDQAHDPDRPRRPAVGRRARAARARCSRRPGRAGLRGADRGGVVARRADGPRHRRHGPGRGHRPRHGGAAAQGARPRRAGRRRPGRGGGPGGGQRRRARPLPRRTPRRRRRPGSSRPRVGRGARRHGRGRGRDGHRPGRLPGPATGRGGPTMAGTSGARPSRCTGR